MSGVRSFMLLVSVPAMAALGHDAWLYYENQDKGFMFAALGFIWTRYHPDSYKWTVENLPEYWPYINALLVQKAFFVGIAFAAFFYIILGLMRLVKVGPFSQADSGRFSGGGSKLKESLGLKKKGTFKYKRK